jgi:mannose-6-phosphate isomerase-like protein (cupin superfamily)
MTAVNDELHNPVTGEHVRFLTVAFDRMRAEITVDPRAGGPPVHQHPIAAETFAVRSGRVRMRNGSHRTTLEAGQSITVAAGVRHGFWNDHDEPAVLIVEWEPATRMAEFLEAVYRLARQGKVRPDGKPGLLQMAVLLDEYRDSIALPAPSLALQRRLFAVLGALGRRRGYTIDGSAQH